MRERDEVPTMTGLALALGFVSRRELERAAAQGTGKTAALLTQAATRVEEENVRALYRKDTGAGAKFVLQNEFGYDRREDPDFTGVIRVNIEQEE